MIISGHAGGYSSLPFVTGQTDFQLSWSKCQAFLLVKTCSAISQSPISLSKTSICLDQNPEVLLLYLVLYRT